MTRRLLLISNSTNFGSKYFQHCEETLKQFLSGVSRVLFIPYALFDHDGYAKKVGSRFEEMGFQLESIHQNPDPVAAVKNAEAIFIGGGNTFRLLKTLYDEKLVSLIRQRVLEDGIPYVGSSAGTNVATISINTTNDMPIVFPPSFSAIGLVPFNINPHYVDTDANSQHMGETRQERIQQYHEIEDAPHVLGLREGTWLHVHDNEITLQGSRPARLFVRGKEPQEFAPDSKLSFLLE